MAVFQRKVTSMPSHIEPIKPFKMIDLPPLKPIETDSVPKKKGQSLKEWAMAGGGVPASYRGREDYWHNKVRKMAAGGGVFNTAPDLSDSADIIQGPSYARGGAVRMQEGGKAGKGGKANVALKLFDIVSDVSKKADEILEAKKAGKLEEAMKSKQAPMTSPQGTGLPLMPRSQGMYTPNVKQEDLPRMAKVDKARAEGKSPAYTERMQDLLDSPTVRKKVDKLINKGKELNVQEWYGTEPLRQVAMDAGLSEDKYREFLAQLASASQRNPVDQQNRMGSYLYYLSQTGQLPEDAFLLTNKIKKDPSLRPEGTPIELPEGYGSLAQGDIFKRGKQIASGDIMGALPPEKKLGTFYRNYLGNLRPVTVDVNAVRGPIIERGDPRWLASKLVEKDEEGNIIATHFPRRDVAEGRMSLKEAKERPGFWEAAPSGSEYAGFEDLWQRGAKRHDMSPAEAQALGWYGSADVTALKTKPELYIDNLERMIKRTAEETGQHPLKVMDDVIKGKGYLYKEGGEVHKADGGKIAKGVMGALEKASKAADAMLAEAAAAEKLAKQRRIDMMPTARIGLPAPGIIIPGKINNVREAVRGMKGNYGARRVERAADEIPNLERMYQEDALKDVFTGDNAKAMMTLDPARFEEFATPISSTFTRPNSVRHTSSGEQVTFPEYIEYLRSVGGFNDVPFFEINKQRQGTEAIPFISGHEGRHRNRALSQSGEKAGLVQLLPRSELREPFPRRSQEDYIEALKKELEMTGNIVLPQINPNQPNVPQRRAIDLPDIYAKGGAVEKHFDGGGMAAADFAGSGDDGGNLDKAKLMAKILADMAKEQGSKEVESLKKPRALTDLLNRGVLANNPLSAGVDILNMGLGAVGLGSDKPFLGSEHLKGLMDKYNITSGEERPMMETALSFASPTAMIKGAMKTTEAAKKAPELVKKASDALTSSKIKPLSTEAKTAQAGKPTGATYATKQEGPFFRVSPTTLDVSAAKSRGIREADELQGQTPVGGTTGQVGSELPTRIADEEVARIIADPVANEPLNIAKKYTQETQGTDFVLPEIPESSLVKQSAIGRTHQLAVEGAPEYKTAVFDAYAKQMPDVLEQAGAKNYDDLMEKAYRQLAKETDAQFQALPYNFSYHRAGEGNYSSSKEMAADVHGNKHLYVFQGGDPHDFLNRVDPSTGLNENEKFRAVHDLLGHAIFGNQFGPKGEETAWAIHSQMYSPLARLAMTAETRGQNSMVNYSPLNANLKAEIAKYDSMADEARRRGDKALLSEINAAKRQAYSGFQYAPQKAVLLPPEFLSPQYAGGMPSYLAAANRPTKGTETQSVLTHFSNDPNLQFTDPRRYGSGIKGAEGERLREYPGAVRDRSYFYLGEPGMVAPEPGLGANRYRGESSSLYDITQDPLSFRALARESNRVPYTAKYNQGVTYPLQEANDMERLVKEYGYEGMANPQASKPMAIMFKETPVQRQKRGGLSSIK